MARNRGAGNADHFTANEPETQGMDDHVQYDQGQAPCPVGAPIQRVANEEAENGLAISGRHGYCLNIFCTALSTVCWFLLPLLLRVSWPIPRHTNCLFLAS